MSKFLNPEEASGMTVNERLVTSGLMSEFDRAVAARDTEALRAILSQVYLDSENVEAVIEQVLG